MPETSLAHLAQCYIVSHATEWTSRHTAAYYDGILNRFLWYARREEWPEGSQLITEHHIREFLGYVSGEVSRWGAKSKGAESSARRASPRTVHHYYRALTAFFNWVVDEGFLDESPVAKVKLTQPKRKVIRPYTLEQLEGMLAICEWDSEHRGRFIGSRNRAIILLLLDTGLRLTELANIRLQNIDGGSGWIKVTGKGGKERVVRIGQTAQNALQQYLMHRPEHGRKEVWLTSQGKPLHSTGIQSMIDRIKVRAGIADEGCVHRFRHTFAVSFLRTDGNPFNLQYLLGHSSLEMVRHYVATLGMEDALKAHIKASPADNMITGFICVTSDGENTDKYYSAQREGAIREDFEVLKQDVKSLYC